MKKKHVVQTNKTMKKDKNNISITPPATDNSQNISTLLGLSADNNEEHILGADVPIVNIDLSGVEAKLTQIAETQDKIYELLKKDDTNIALKAMLWTTLTLHFKRVENLADNFKRSLSNSKSVLDYMIQQLKI